MKTTIPSRIYRFSQGKWKVFAHFSILLFIPSYVSLGSKIRVGKVEKYFPRTKGGFSHIVLGNYFSTFPTQILLSMLT
jgi:hypothetical protein